MPRIKNKELLTEYEIQELYKENHKKAVERYHKKLRNKGIKARCIWLSDEQFYVVKIFIGILKKINLYRLKGVDVSKDMTNFKLVFHDINNNATMRK